MKATRLLFESNTDVKLIIATPLQLKQIRRLEIDEFVEYPPDKDKTSEFKTFTIRFNNNDVGFIRLNFTPPDAKEMYYGKYGKKLLSTVDGAVGVSGFFIYPKYRNMGIGKEVLIKLQKKYDKIYYAAGDESVTHLLTRLGFHKFMEGSSDGIHSHWICENK